MLHGQPQQLCMIILHLKDDFFVPVIGKGGRIDEDQVVLFAGLLQPLPAVALDGDVLRPAKAVQGHVGPGPLQIGGGAVDQGGGRCPVHEGMNGGCPGVAEQVEESYSHRQAAEHGPDFPVVEKETGIQVVGEVDQEAAALLPDLVEFALARPLLILFLPFAVAWF